MVTLGNKPLFCNRQLESLTQKRAHKRNVPNIAAINNEEVVMKRPQRIILKLYLQTFFFWIIIIFGYKEKKTKTKIIHQRRKNETGQKWINDQHSNIAEIGIEHTYVKITTCENNHLCLLERSRIVISSIQLLV